MIQLTVNGETQTYEGEGDLPLLWYLREFLGLTGKRFRELPRDPRLDLGG